MAELKGTSADYKADIEHNVPKSAREGSLAQRTIHRLSVTADDASTKEGQLFSMGGFDPALDAKMRLVNNVSISFCDLESEPH